MVNIEFDWIMRIYNGHRFEMGIFSPRDDRTRWYPGFAEVPHGPVIPRVENADLNLMPHYRFFFLHTTNFYDKNKCFFFAVYLAIYIVLKLIDHSQLLWLRLPGLCANNNFQNKYTTQSSAIFIVILKQNIGKKSKKSK